LQHVSGSSKQQQHAQAFPLVEERAGAAPSECGMGVCKPLQVWVVGGHGLLWVADLPNLVMQAVPPLSSLLLVAVWAIHG
jgi:hypothetical protein